MNKISCYLWNILIAIDQFVNTLCGGDPDETISSRLGKWHQTGRDSSGVRKGIYIVINWIVELFQKDHFKKSIEENRGDRKIIN